MDCILILLSVSLWLPELSVKLAEMSLLHHVASSNAITMPSNARLTLPVHTMSNVTQSLLDHPSLSHNRSRTRDMFFEYIRLYLSQIGEMGNGTKDLMMKKVRMNSK